MPNCKRIHHSSNLAGFPMQDLIHLRHCVFAFCYYSHASSTSLPPQISHGSQSSLGCEALSLLWQGVVALHHSKFQMVARRLKKMSKHPLPSASGAIMRRSVVAGMRCLLQKQFCWVEGRVLDLAGTLAMTAWSVCVPAMGMHSSAVTSCLSDV